jgi:DNA gyrase, B subunit
VTKKNLYTEESIVSESPREFTRRVPSTYLGSAKRNQNLIKEVFANAADEHVIGHGDNIKIIIDTKKNFYSVEDCGQGFLVNAGIDQNGKTILQRSFDTINTSGKTTEDGVYQGTALGLNGIGAKITNWLSTSLHVKTYRDGEFEEIWFKDGLFDKRKVGKEDHVSGTIVEWSPDPKFFKDNTPDIEYLKTYFEEISALCPNLTIELDYNGSEFIYHTLDGLDALMSKRVAGKELFSNRFVIERELGKDKLNICLTYTTDYSDNITAYVNLGHTDSGAHLSAMKTAFVKAVNKYATENNLLKKKDKNFSSNEISEGLNIIFNMTTTTAKYDAQNKSRIDDIDATIINNVMSGDFATWLSNNPSEAAIIIERALNSRKAREAAKKAKEKIRGVSKKNSSLFIDMPTKLADAYPKNKKDRSQCELYICEGLSAASSITATRDASKIAVLPIRGKILNCMKASLDKVYANQEVADITRALGLDVDKDTGKLIYNPKKLRYNKIVIATDADADASSITMLLCTVFDWLCPELFTNGHIYKVYGALFKVTLPDNSYLLFSNDKEFNAWKEQNKDLKYKVARAKGLGEMTAEETFEQLVNEETRNLKMITTEDYEEFEKYLNIFEGADVTARKEYLEKYYEERESNN